MKTQNTVKNKESSSSSFYPRIIREFEECDEPMMYGGKY